MAALIRGNGLFEAHDALAALAEDPRQLDRARGRFSESPPSYRSQSGTSTRSPSAPPLRDEQQTRSEREWQIRIDHQASHPSNQYEAQVSEERERLYDGDRNRTHRLPAGTDFFKLAEDNVKKRWVEQGIWNEKWKYAKVWKWKHEESADAEPQPRVENAPPLFSFATAEPASSPQTNSDSAKTPTQISSREREASRPFFQFVNQISEERERIQNSLRAAEGADVADSPTINTEAYEKVKSTWIERGIWNKKWGVFPGMSWKHEQDITELLREELGDNWDQEPVAAANVHEEVALPPPMFGLFGVGPNHPVLNTVFPATEPEDNGTNRRHSLRRTAQTRSHSHSIIDPDEPQEPMDLAPSVSGITAATSPPKPNTNTDPHPMNQSRRDSLNGVSPPQSARKMRRGTTPRQPRQSKVSKPRTTNDKIQKRRNLASALLKNTQGTPKGQSVAEADLEVTLRRSPRLRKKESKPLVDKLSKPTVRIRRGALGDGPSKRKRKGVS